MKLKNFWSYELKRYEQCTPELRMLGWCEAYFNCDYTSQTCQRGYYSRAMSVFLVTLLAQDRKTELA